MWRRSEWYSTDSTMSTHHYFTASSPDYPNLLGQLGQYSSLRVHPYAYPQHMNVLKHFHMLYNMDVEKK
jgi:hypothetical protein